MVFGYTREDWNLYDGAGGAFNFKGSYDQLEVACERAKLYGSGAHVFDTEQEIIFEYSAFYGEFTVSNQQNYCMKRFMVFCGITSFYDDEDGGAFNYIGSYDTSIEACERAIDEDRNCHVFDTKNAQRIIQHEGDRFFIVYERMNGIFVEGPSLRYDRV